MTQNCNTDISNKIFILNPHISILDAVLAQLTTENTSYKLVYKLIHTYPTYFDVTKHIGIMIKISITDK